MNPLIEERILYFQSDRRRTEWKRQSRNPLWPGGPQATFYEPHSALIETCDGDAKKSFSIDLDNRTYAPVVLRQKLSADQIKALQNRVPKLETTSRPSVLHEITTVDRGERKQVFGYTARRVATTLKVTPLQGTDVMPQETITDGWYIDLNTRLSCDPLDEAPREGTTYSVARLMGAVSSTNPASVSASAPSLVQTTYIGKPESGFPVSVKTTTRSPISAQGHQTEQVSTTEIEVTEFSTTNLDASLFEVPPSFRMVTQILPIPQAALWARWLARAHGSWLRFREAL